MLCSFMTLRLLIVMLQLQNAKYEKKKKKSIMIISSITKAIRQTYL